MMQRFSDVGKSPRYQIMIEDENGDHDRQDGQLHSNDDLSRRHE